MKITDEPRDAARRKRDVPARLGRERDVWVASADADGIPYLVALWFARDGESFWLSTRAANPTGRALRHGRRARPALGDTQDVMLVDGDVETYDAGQVPAAAAEAFTDRTGWDPRRESAAYAFFRVRPRAVQAWHGVHELPGRHVMRDGVWTSP
ncbi:pyridoxamine 5'-phosphate oxidase family protein [Streptomyces sp. NPDC058733]|uniref:pyridoxamine 5'-phosphate oxidase family protein n=1 Tax=Streptomyces sp. NPDC058733 TaxID=3346614 RepID=UPI00368FA88E